MWWSDCVQLAGVGGTGGALPDPGELGASPRAVASWQSGTGIGSRVLFPSQFFSAKGRLLLDKAR